VSIGEALMQARERAGLTIAQVSQQTRIRAAIIASIEDDDHGACGGDFYARGHIRAIARAIGTDPEPLIREFDAQRAPPPGQEETGTQPATGWRRRRSARPGREASHLAWEAMRPDRESSLDDRDSVAPPQQEPQQQKPRRHPGDVAAGPQAGWRNRDAAPTGIRRPIMISGFLLALVVAGGLAGYHFLSGPARPARAGPPAGRHASAGSAASTTPPAPARSSAAPVAASPLTAASATAFGVPGPGRGDHDDRASLAIDASPGTAWRTDWYATADFGHLYRGTGLLLDLGKPAVITSARIALGAVRGASLQLRVGDSPSLAALRPVASAAGAGGALRLSPTAPARGRYVLIWFTRLPPDPAGTFRGYVYDVRLSGRS